MRKGENKKTEVKEFLSKCMLYDLIKQTSFLRLVSFYDLLNFNGNMLLIISVTVSGPCEGETFLKKTA